ncbi:trehalose-phosphatase [Halomarina litorea]|uniref:trehalose-phosphatase n=1 Tax=Halomarina litorea TaxID=2961595 RepID=UPI0020C21BED|nr:trehalose-phosphatase [Halomarina sp. BCD28]
MPDATRPGSASDDRAPLVGNWLSRIDDHLHAAGGLLLCLDFDGTLAHIAEDPTTVAPTAECRRALVDLADREDVRVAVISGRALDDVRDRVGLDGIYYAGNHGLELDEVGDTVVHPVAEKHRPTVRAACEALSDRLVDEPGCHVEDKGVTATVHHRLAPDERTARIRALVRSTVEEVGGDALRLTPAKAAIELRPDLDWGKGDAVRTFRERVSEDYLPMYVGDDSTDESAFEAVAADGIGVHVGDGRDTAATFRVPDPDGVASFLDWLSTRE